MWLLKIRRLVRHAGREALILFFAMRHPGTPMALKLASAAALAYVISELSVSVPKQGGLNSEPSSPRRI